MSYALMLIGETMIESAEEFYRLRTSDDPEEYARAAHETASDAVWQEVIARYPDMRVWVAHNKTVPLPILEILARDEDWRVRHMVASKRKLSEEMQVRLAHDPDEGVRRALVSNARASPRMLAQLAHDPVADIHDRAIVRLSTAPTQD